MSLRHHQRLERLERAVPPPKPSVPHDEFFLRVVELLQYEGPDPATIARRDAARAILARAQQRLAEAKAKAKAVAGEGQPTA